MRHGARREQRPRGRSSRAAAASSSDDPVDAPPLQRARDDQALDLARALPDPVDAQLAEVALGRVLAHVAAAAEDLEHAVRAGERGLGGEQLGERRLRVDDLRVRAGVGEPGGLAREQPRRGGVRRGIREREADALEVEDPARRTGPAPSPTRRASVSSRSIAPGAARADVDPLVDEPLVREVVRGADRRRAARRPGRARPRARTAGAGRRTCACSPGRPVIRQPGRVVVDEEQRRPPLARPRRPSPARP